MAMNDRMQLDSNQEGSARGIFWRAIPRVTGRVKEKSFVRVSPVQDETLSFRLQNKIQKNLCLKELAVFADKRFRFILSHYMMMHQVLKIF